MESRRVSSANPHDRLLVGLAPSQFGGFAGLPDGHPAQLLHVEVLSASEGKCLYKTMLGLLILGTAVTISRILFLALGEEEDVETSTQDAFMAPFASFDNIVAIVILVCMSISMVRFTRRILQGRRAGLEWTKRRRRLCTLAACNALGIIVVLIANMFSKLWEALRPCAWFDTAVFVSDYVGLLAWLVVFAIIFIRLRCMDVWTRGPTPHSILLDSPWSGAWPALPFVAVIMGFGVLDIAAMVENRYAFLSEEDTQECRKDQERFIQERWRRINCALPTGSDIASWGIQITILLFAVGLALFAFMARTRLSGQHKEDFRLSHMLYGLFRRFHLPAVLLALVSAVSLSAMKFSDESSSCMTFGIRRTAFNVVTWFFATSATFDLYLFMPELPSDNIVPAELRQIYSWTEATRNAIQDVRSKLHQAMTTDRAPSIRHEPLYCVETGVNLFYWSCLPYFHRLGVAESATGEAGVLSIPISPAQAADDASSAVAPAAAIRTAAIGERVFLSQCMAFYDLREHKIFEDPRVGLYVMLAWGPSHVVLSARGTVNRINARKDLKVNLTPYEMGSKPERGRPKIHTGFSETWRCGTHSAIVQKVAELVAASNDPGAMRILATGHSLGGALATLAILQIAEEVPGLGQQQLSLYTYGAPHVGNRAFARYADERVPDTWHVINDQDAVTRVGKFFRYKRAGQRVLLGRSGGMVVRPNPLENSLHLAICGAAVGHHFLSLYERSFYNICTRHAASGHGADGSTDAASLLETHPILSTAGGPMQSLDLEATMEDVQLEMLAAEDRMLSRRMLSQLM